NGRQWTTAPDDLSGIINFGAYPSSFTDARVPAVPLGFDQNGAYFETRVGWAIIPSWWPGNCSLGSFRAFHTRPFNQYINGKVYDKIFWAPKDYTVEEDIFQYRADPGQWPGAAASFYFSTYCMGISAMVNSEVFARAENRSTERREGTGLRQVRAP